MLNSFCSTILRMTFLPSLPSSLVGPLARQTVDGNCHCTVQWLSINLDRRRTHGVEQSPAFRICIRFAAFRVLGGEFTQIFGVNLFFSFCEMISDVRNPVIEG